jgi:hypothetical protein
MTISGGALTGRRQGRVSGEGATTRVRLHLVRLSIPMPGENLTELPLPPSILRRRCHVGYLFTALAVTPAVVMSAVAVGTGVSSAR